MVASDESYSVRITDLHHDVQRKHCDIFTYSFDIQYVYYKKTFYVDQQLF